MEDSHSRRFPSLMWTGMASCQCLQGIEVEASTLLSISNRKRSRQSSARHWERSPPLAPAVAVYPIIQVP